MNWIVRILIVIVALAGFQSALPSLATAGQPQRAAVSVASHHDHAQMMAGTGENEKHRQPACGLKAAFCCQQAPGLLTADLTVERLMFLDRAPFLPVKDERLAGLAFSPPREPPRTTLA